MEAATTTTYALLALLGMRQWASYELTKQARRSLRYVWPSSEANLYREQRRLVRLGWARGTVSRHGARSRTTYGITPKGRRALRDWLETDPASPALEIEAALRAFFADGADTPALVRSLQVTAAASAGTVSSLASFATEYLENGGPFPERLHLIALAMDMLVCVHSEIGRYCTAAAKATTMWPTTSGIGMSDATRAVFERIATQAIRSGAADPAGAQSGSDPDAVRNTPR